MVVNETTTDVAGNGGGSGAPSGPGTTAREVTCVKIAEDRLSVTKCLIIRMLNDYFIMY